MGYCFRVFGRFRVSSYMLKVHRKLLRMYLRSLGLRVEGLGFRGLLFELIYRVCWAEEPTLTAIWEVQVNHPSPRPRNPKF